MSKPKIFSANSVLYILPLFFLLTTGSAISSQTRVFLAKLDYGSRPTLEVRVSLNKDTFLLYEPVIGEVWAKNVSSDDAEIYFYNTWGIQDRNGQDYSPGGTTVCFPNGIKPGDSLGGTIDLFEEAGGALAMVSSGAYYRYRCLAFPIGEYKVHPPFAPDSISLIFHVVEPWGDEVKALELYLDALSPFTRENYRSSSVTGGSRLITESVSKLELVADIYPKSVYAGLALSEAARMASSYERKLSYQIITRLIQEYPEVALWTWAIAFLRVHYQNENYVAGFEEELKRIIELNADEKLTARAREALRELEWKGIR